MRNLFVFIILFVGFQSFAQQVNYFRVSLGPKWEKYTVTNPGLLEVVPHIDVSAGLYIGKNINENWRAEIGILKNDYSAKFELVLPETTFYEGFVYPTITTYQLPVLAMYEKAYNENLSYFARGGFHLFLSKKESRTGVNFMEEVKVDKDGNILNQADLTTFANGLESGNILFRGDIGVFYWVNEFLSLEVAAGVKASTLPLNSFKVDYDSSADTHQNATFSTNGMATHLHLGIRYQFAK